MAKTSFGIVVAILALPVAIFVGIAFGPAVLVLLLIAAIAAPWLLIAGATRRRGGTR
jgi:hypothetical protein